MQLLVRIVLGYLFAGAAVIALVRDDPAVAIGDLLRSIPSALQLFTSMDWWVAPLAGAFVVLIPREELMRRLPRAVLAVFLATAFFLTFTMVKTALPLIVPFWADPMLAAADEALHFGHAPWALTHRLAAWVNADFAARVYLELWTPVALFFPVFLFLLDGNAARVRRFVVLYAFAWIGLGNLLALGFMSAGPVFYDRIAGGELFAGLTAALGRAGVLDSQVGTIQKSLWLAYSMLEQKAGSGISAFPSVHLAMATVVGLYLFDRWRALLPLSVALVALYQFLSVYLGWHYAIDGYFSIAVIAGVWRILRRRAALSDGVAPTGPAILAQQAA